MIASTPFAQSLPFSACAIAPPVLAISGLESASDGFELETSSVSFPGDSSLSRSASRFARFPHSLHMKSLPGQTGGSDLAKVGEFFNGHEIPRIDFETIRREADKSKIILWQSYTELIKTNAIVLARDMESIHGDGFGGSFVDIGEVTEAFISPALGDPEIFSLHLTYFYRNHNIGTFDRASGGRTWWAALDMKTGEMRVVARGEGVRDWDDKPAKRTDLERFVYCLDILLRKRRGNYLNVIELLRRSTDIKPMTLQEMLVEALQAGGEWARSRDSGRP